MGIVPRDDIETRLIVPGDYHYIHHHRRRGSLQHEQQQNQEGQEQGRKLVTAGMPAEGGGGTELALIHLQGGHTCCTPPPSFFDCLDYVLLFSCFRGVPGFAGERSDHSRRRARVTVKVGATVVRNDVASCGGGPRPGNSNSNSSSRAAAAAAAAAAGRWKRHLDLDTRLGESAFVGVVEEIETERRRLFQCGANAATSGAEAAATPTGRVQKGTLVTSIRKCATKARLVTMLAEDLIALPAHDDLDMGEVAALVSTYLPAFGALYHGLDLRLREGRFTKGSLTGCTILISGGWIVEAEAVTKLALLGGASRVFLFQTESGMTLEKTNDKRVFALSGEPEDHKSRLHQAMDVIIDLGSLMNFEFLRSSLSPKGRLVCIAPKGQTKNLVTRINEFVGQATLIKVPGTSIFDFQEMSTSSYGEVIRDLQYLLDLTQRRKLRPRVDRYIKPRDVEIMQEDMARRPPRGAVICEPWREHRDPDAISSLEQLEAWSHTMCARSIHS